MRAITGAFLGTPRLVVATVGLLGLMLAASGCSTLSDEVDETTSPSTELQSEAVEPSGAAIDSGVSKPTFDGSATPSATLDGPWVEADTTPFLPSEPNSSFSAAVALGDDKLMVVGGTRDYETRQQKSTVWNVTFSPVKTSAVRSYLPQHVDGLDSWVFDIAEIESSLAVEGVSSKAVAVGSVGSVSGERAAVWLFDGQNWEIVADEAFASLSAERAWSVGATTSGFVALGASLAEDGSSTPQIWESDDGSTWRRSELDGADEEGITLGGVVHDGDVVLIYGRRQVEAASTPLLWSRRGEGPWVLVESEAFTTDHGAVVGSVVARPEGGFLAAGYVEDGDNAIEPAVWMSPEGSQWTLVDSNFEYTPTTRVSRGGQGLGTLIVADDGYLAGATNSFVPDVWRSPDGISWEPAGDILGERTGNISINDLVLVDDRLLAVDDNRLLRRANKWSRVSLPEGQVPVGSSDWVADLASAEDGTFLAVGTTVGDNDARWARSWTSQDGVEWGELGWSNGDESYKDGAYAAVVADNSAPGTFLALSPEQKSQESAPYLGTGVRRLDAEGQGTIGTARTDTGRYHLHALTVTDTALYAGGWHYDGAEVTPYLARESRNSETTELSLQEVEVLPKDLPDAFSWQELCSFGDVVVAVLQVEAFPLAHSEVWTLSGDQGWSQTLDTRDAALGGSLTPSACGTSSDGFLLGLRRYEGTHVGFGLWHSPDGQSWSEIAGPLGPDDETGARVSDIAYHDGRWFVIGSRNDQGANTGVLWTVTRDEMVDGMAAEDWIELPATNNPTGFVADNLEISSDGLVLVEGTQQGQTTMAVAPVEELLNEES